MRKLRPENHPPRAAALALKRALTCGIPAVEVQAATVIMDLAAVGELKRLLRRLARRCSQRGKGKP